MGRSSILLFAVAQALKVSAVSAEALPCEHRPTNMSQPGNDNLLEPQSPARYYLVSAQQHAPDVHEGTFASWSNSGLTAAPAFPLQQQSSICYRSESRLFSGSRSNRYTILQLSFTEAS